MAEKLSQKLTPNETLPQIGNNYQRTFFLLSSNRTDYYLHAAISILGEILINKELFSKVGIVADEPDKNMLGLLLNGNRQGGNEKFWEEAKKPSI